jgi:hypothetical protein
MTPKILPANILTDLKLVSEILIKTNAINFKKFEKSS